ncbi:hypothetical protein OE88DRAFT_1651554 [Heliocybe sulcata]|uniref:Uncharacterized protein n=1 Tax=Heliocybe sulcata TaxID=5364 RepID=A0A5C3NNC3_9AGAM|nr:hypothetical protein OE88DRAFT_1651554 [Heliocybe sulcata]
MPPKPRPRNASTAPKGSPALSAAKPPSTKDAPMPPPPNPPTPQAILEPEITALQGCLRASMLVHVGRTGIVTCTFNRTLS